MGPDSSALQRLRRAYDPTRFRESGHELVDRLADYLDDALGRRLPAVVPWVDPAEQLARTPRVAEEAGSGVKELSDDLLRRAFHLHDPRTMGHQDGLPMPTASLAGLLTSVLNNDPSVYETGPAVVPMEVRLLRWMADEIGFPEGAGGILTGGGSLGNFTALLAARQAKAGFDVWHEGERRGDAPCALVSDHAHYCVARATRMMGWGDEGAEKVRTDGRYRMDPEDLPAALERARARGRRPIAVVASSCTTATGSFDPLVPIADFCEAEGLWLHVDGAHGAPTILSPRYRALVEGMERADSVVWDCHKMMMLPAVLTAVLFKDVRHSYETFRQEATYLFEERPDEEWYNPGNRTVECTRPGSAVLLYTALRVHGAGLFRDYVTCCYDLSRRLAERVAARPDFELLTEPQANIVCFRHRPEGAGDLDALQAAIRRAIVTSGDFYLTQAELDGVLALRCTLQNPFTTDDDLDGLLDRIREQGGAATPRYED